MVIAVLASFILVYFAALNWYHVTIWGEELRSIQRYSRIPIRAFHLVGLVLLFVNIAELLLHRDGTMLKRLVQSNLLFVLAIGLVVVLAGWQVRQIDRRVTDLSTRKFQHVAAYHATLPKSAKRMNEILKRFGGRKVNILVIQQGGNPDILEVAHYHLVSNSYRSGIPNVQFHNAVSWPLASSDASGAKSASERLHKALLEADVIWPVRLDQEMSLRLRTMLGPNNCGEPLSSNIFLVNHQNPPQLRCVSKGN